LHVAMQALVQPLLKPPRIFIELLGAGNAAKVETKFSYKLPDLLGMLYRVVDCS